MEAILYGDDAHKLAKVAQVYRSDDQMFEIFFNKTIRAEGRDIIITVDQV